MAGGGSVSTCGGGGCRIVADATELDACALLNTSAWDIVMPPSWYVAASAEHAAVPARMLAHGLRLGGALLVGDRIVLSQDRPERHEYAETDSHAEDQRERQQAYVEAVVRHGRRRRRLSLDLAEAGEQD
eukprot:4974934-Pyramimonas_sp.AAC.1